MKYSTPLRLQKGDKVAIVSPSSGMAYLFPLVFELGLKRMREIFHLKPVEFPTARQTPKFLSKNPEARAKDINDAFADPSIKAIFATIGGNDEIRILPYLDAEMIKANPKPFIGYSDNTNIHLYLWNLGIVSYYGGHVMNQFAMQGKMHAFTQEFIKKALFEPKIGNIHASTEWTDFDLDWTVAENLAKERPLYPNDGWRWHNNKGQVLEGRLWGGCLETLYMHLAVRKYLPKDLEGSILYLETSEEMPSEGVVYNFIAALAEANLLKQFKAILFARPKAQFCGRVPPEGSKQFVVNQERAVKNALQDYGFDLPVVFNLDFGHTDPQILIPNGGIAKIDGREKTITIL